MIRNSPHRCPDCGSLTDKFLCERCAQVCENLTASGEYYRYWVRRYQPSAKEKTEDSTAETRQQSPRPSLR